MYVSKKYSEKLEKYLWHGLFYNKSALLNKKCSHNDNKGKSAFQTVVIELCKQPKKTTKNKNKKTKNKKRILKISNKRC